MPSERWLTTFTTSRSPDLTSINGPGKRPVKDQDKADESGLNQPLMVNTVFCTPLGDKISSARVKLYILVVAERNECISGDK